jgi:hypothetical protein
MTDEPGWITKRDAATRAGVDERTIERKARAGKLNARARPGFPTLYSEADVEKLAQTTFQEVRTGVLTAGTAGNGNGHRGIVASSPKPTEPYTVANDPIRQLAALVVQALTHGPTGATGPTITPTGPTAETLVLTLEEAAAVSGWSVGFLRRARASGKLPADRDRWRGADGRWHVGWKIRRKDLEAL